MGNDVYPSERNDHLATSGPFQIAPDPLMAGPSEVKTEIPEIAGERNVDPEADPLYYEDLGDLPAYYQTGKVYLAARDPHWLFVYWDVNLANVDRKLMLEDESGIYLKVFTAGGDLIDQIRVNTQARNWYFPVQETGTTYFVELGFYDTASKWTVIGKSNEASAPTDQFSEGPVEFASVPFHLSFDRMLKIVQADLADGTSLVGALSHLQSSSEKTIWEMSATWTSDQKSLLETLVGPELISQISLGSGEMDQIFRSRLSEALSAASSSSMSSELPFLKSLVSVPWTESSLSGVGASWSSGVGGEASWSSGLGSIWSGQPFSSAPRDFFMHVNAEVIFYGGTHSDATVWIDGKEITLSPDGSFRYHFRLPDGEFEIPIVAESPDGVEIRSAKLVFKRGTSRTGEVGSSPQPNGLSAPMGAQ